MNKSKLQGHAAMLVSSIIFGANIPISKQLLPDWMSPWAMTYSRFAFGAVMFWVLSIFMPRTRIPKKDMVRLFIGSMLGVGINQASFIFGLQLTAPTDASIVITVMPIMAMIIAFFMLKEPITFKKAGGVFLGLVGVLCIILTASYNSGSHGASVAGDLFCMLSCLSYAFFLVITRDISKRYDAITIMKWMFLFSSIVTFPFGFHDLINAPIFTSGNRAAWSSYAYLLIGATFLTYLLIPMAQKRIRPTTIGMYNYVQPLVASLIAISTGQDEFSWVKPAAAVLIFIGVYLVTTSKSREDVEKEMQAKSVSAETGKQ
jgi:drug/metabolite transporter (DMT)-like permease